MRVQGLYSTAIDVSASIYMSILVRTRNVGFGKYCYFVIPTANAMPRIKHVNQAEAASFQDDVHR